MRPSVRSSAVAALFITVLLLHRRCSVPIMITSLTLDELGGNLGKEAGQTA
ncbi:hypothetical protein HanIR_Chr16g0787701 [Helianthus annuus]|nr:hypothetical protein HanIR_Chr16g0787701 [Helianthus annuus]